MPDWSDAEWLANAGAYHSQRIGASAWDNLSPEKKSQALLSARDLLKPWENHVNFIPAVYEQALWLTTSDSTQALNDYSSVSVSTSAVSVSFGRKMTTTKPPWLSPLAWALLESTTTGAGGWAVGRVV